MNFATWYDCGLTFSSGTRTCTCTLLATIDIHVYTCTPEKESSHPWAMGDTHNRIRVHVEGFHGLYIFYTFRILHEYKISSRQHPTPNTQHAFLPLGSHSSFCNRSKNVPCITSTCTSTSRCHFHSTFGPWGFGGNIHVQSVVEYIVRCRMSGLLVDGLVKEVISDLATLRHASASKPIC